MHKVHFSCYSIDRADPAACGASIWRVLRIEVGMPVLLVAELTATCLKWLPPPVRLEEGCWKSVCQGSCWKVGGLRSKVAPTMTSAIEDNSNHDSFFAPPQPTTLRLSLGDGGAEILTCIQVPTPHQVGNQLLFWGVFLFLHHFGACSEQANVRIFCR